MIGFYKMSLIGSSHLAKPGGICQDSCDVKVLDNGWVIAAIADGLGSAKHSEVGSRLAVDEVLYFIEANIPEYWHTESLISLLRTSYHSALKCIKGQALLDGNPVFNYDTTLTSVVYNGTNAIYGHVGDGGIITLNPYGEFDLLTFAQKGDEFNEVFPLRSGPEKWLFGESKESVAALLMLTDGVYDVACPWLIAKHNQKIHVNYVRPFIDRNILAVNTAADFENAQREIEEFFTSKDSQQITDDKTVLGIVNTDVLPEVKADDYYTEPNWGRIAEDHWRKLYGNKKTEPINLDKRNNTSIISSENEVDSETKEQEEPMLQLSYEQIEKKLKRSKSIVDYLISSLFWRRFFNRRS